MVFVSNLLVRQFANVSMVIDVLCNDMFKGKAKIKTELEVFSEQRYKDAAVVIYRQLKGKVDANSQLPTTIYATTEIRKGWVDSEEPGDTMLHPSDNSTIKDRTVGEPSRLKQSQNPVLNDNSVQSKVCSVL